MKSIIKVILLSLIIAFARARLVDDVVRISEKLIAAVKGGDSGLGEKMTITGCETYSEYEVEGCKVCGDDYQKYCFYKDRSQNFCVCNKTSSVTLRQSLFALSN